MSEQGKQPSLKRGVASDPVVQSDPASLKDNPESETVCSPYFSTGCINEDTDTATEAQEGEYEEYKSGDHLL